MKLKPTKQPVTQIAIAICAPERLRGLTWCYASLLMLSSLASCSGISRDLAHASLHTHGELSPLATISHQHAFVFDTSEIEEEFRRALEDGRPYPALTCGYTEVALPEADSSLSFRVDGVTEAYVPLTDAVSTIFHVTLDPKP